MPSNQFRKVPDGQTDSLRFVTIKTAGCIFLGGIPLLLFPKKKFKRNGSDLFLFFLSRTLCLDLLCYSSTNSNPTHQPTNVRHNNRWLRKLEIKIQLNRQMGTKLADRHQLSSKYDNEVILSQQDITVEN